MGIRNKILAAAATVTLLGGVSAAGALTATTAGAATNSCVSTESCGGAILALTTHGSLSLAVLGYDPSVNDGFGYNNEHVGFTTSGAADGSQDWTLAQYGSGAGPYGKGEYVLEFTPGGHQPGTPDLAYCLSVQDTYPTVGGHVVQRWADVLRWCGAWGGVVTGGKTAAQNGGTELPASVTGADLYQLWAPVEVSGHLLQLEDVALNSQQYRHGWGGGQDFVLDDRADGGSGTWGLAYPNHFGLNQEGVAQGCSQPITTFNPKDFNCPVA